MKRVVAMALALLLSVSMGLCAFAAGSVTNVIEVTPVETETETTYTTESGAVETGAVKITATPDQETAVSKEEVARVEEAAGENYTCVNVFEIKVTVQKGDKEETVTRNQTVEVKLSVTIPEHITLEDIVVVGFVKATGKWERIDRSLVRYNIRVDLENGLDDGVLTVSLDPKYSKVAVTMDFS